MKLLDPRLWHRVGHGRSFEFYASMREIHTALSTGMISEYEPYRLLAASRSEKGKVCSSVFEIDVLASQSLDAPKIGNQLFLYSEKLTDCESSDLDWDLAASWSLSGLIILQIGGRRWDKKYDPSSLGMVTRVSNSEFDECIEHLGYKKVYDAIKRRLNRILSYKTIHEFGDGSRLETSAVRMSDEAAQEYREGFPFLDSPGTSLRDEK